MRRPSILPIVRLAVLAALFAVAALWVRPAPVAASGFSAVSAGGFHSCALTFDGGVQCWGSNIVGQLGDGNAPSNSNTPVAVFGLTSGISSIDSGRFHTCAVTTDTQVRCWGSNIFGQLGDGTTTDSDTPRKVCEDPVVGSAQGIPLPQLCSSPLIDVVAVSAGSGQTCALINNGRIKCWGWDLGGALGNGGSNTNSPTPIEVCADALCLTSLTGAAAVSAGATHTCALTTAGGIKCWGKNGAGQVGDGTTTNRSTPVDVIGLAGVSAVSAGGAGTAPDGHTCSLTNSGISHCWGFNGSGQLGDGTTNDSSTPVTVFGLTAAIDSGGSHGCLITTGGTSKCTGLNSSGQLGHGSLTTPITFPVDVCDVGATPPCSVPNGNALSNVAGVSAGEDHACALSTSGRITCWGENATGQLGNGNNVSSNIPVDIVAPLTKQLPVAPCTAGNGAFPEPGCDGLRVSGSFAVNLTDPPLGNVSCSYEGPAVLARKDNPFASSDLDGDTKRDMRVEIIAMKLQTSCDATVFNGTLYCAIGPNQAVGPNHLCGIGTSPSVVLCGVSDTPGAAGTVEEQTAGGSFFPADVSLELSLVLQLNATGGLIHNCDSGLPNGNLAEVQGTVNSLPDFGASLSLVGPTAPVVLTAQSAGSSVSLALFDELDNEVGAMTGGSLGADDFDSDSDGCTDDAEEGASVQFGGQRDPLSFWDFTDMYTGDPPARSRNVGGPDIAATVLRFGANDTGAGEFDRNSNPLFTPNLPASPSNSRANYHPAFDRSGSVDSNPLHQGPPNGSVGGPDIAAVVLQFGHTCRP